MKTYCRKILKIKILKIKILKTKNNRIMLKSIFAICGTNKSRFINIKMDLDYYLALE